MPDFTELLIAFIGLLGAATVWIRASASQRQEKANTAKWQAATAEAQAAAAQIMGQLSEAQMQQLEQVSAPSAAGPYRQRQESIQRIQERLDDLTREHSETALTVARLEGRMNGGK
jgi:hypothetical protein